MDDPAWRHRGSAGYSDHNCYGFKDACSLQDSRVLLTGSSHCYGTNLTVGQDWPGLLYRAFGLPIFNASMGAWSFFQYKKILECLMHPRHSSAVIAVYTGFDIYASLKQACEVHAVELADYCESGIRLDWRARGVYESFVAEKILSGCSRQSALMLAYEQGLGDLDYLDLPQGRIWLEPVLRTKTQDLGHPFIRGALDFVDHSLSKLKISCLANSCELKLILIPTKEWVAAKVHPSPSASLRNLEEVEDQMHLALEDLARSNGASFLSLASLYLANDIGSTFLVDTEDGHPSPAGSLSIAGFLFGSKFLEE